MAPISVILDGYIFNPVTTGIGWYLTVLRFPHRAEKLMRGRGRGVNTDRCRSTRGQEAQTTRQAYSCLQQTVSFSYQLLHRINGTPEEVDTSSQPGQIRKAISAKIGDI
uniref:Uncharacterized protein n=1 Tax=Oryza brachyantha TaxID=4533 RepID=J3L4Z4_ORYBR